MSAGEPIWYEIYLLCWPPCAKLLYTLNGFQCCFVAMHFTAHFGCFFLQHWLARIHIMTMTLTAAECIRCNIRRLQCFTISVFFKALSTRFKLLWPNGLIVGTDRCNIKHNYLQFNGAWGRFWRRRDYRVQFLQLFFVNVVNVYFLKVGLIRTTIWCGLDIVRTTCGAD